MRGAYHRPMRLYRWLPLLLLVGCGDGGGGDAMDAGNTGDDLGGGGGDLASGGGGGSAKLYPLAVGNQWSYVVTQVGAGSVCAPGTHTQQVTSANPVGGRAAFQMNSFCSGI